MTEHTAYFHDFLGGLYCREDGTEYPCLHNRQLWEAQQDRAVRCLCSHIDGQHELGVGFCSMVACGCRALRPKPVTA